MNSTQKKWLSTELIEKTSKYSRKFSRIIGVLMIIIGLFGMTFGDSREFGTNFGTFMKGIIIFCIVIPIIIRFLQVYITNKYIEKDKYVGGNNLFRTKNQVDVGGKKLLSIIQKNKGNYQAIFKKLFNLFKRKRLYDKTVKEMERLGAKLVVQMELWNEKDDAVIGTKRELKDGTVERNYGDYTAYAIENEDSIFIMVDNAPHSFTQDKLERASKKLLYEYDAQMIRSGKEREEIIVEKNGILFNFEPRKTVELVKKNPLSKGWLVENADEITIDTREGKIYPMIDMFNQKTPLLYHGISGIVIGGVPGSGKSASMLSIILAMLKQNIADVTIFDGKGKGSEFKHFENVAEYYPLLTTRDEDNNRRKNLKELSEKVDEIMESFEKRQNKIDSDGGETNFWNRKFSEDMKIKLIVMDECHNFFETDNTRSDAAKEENLYRENIKKNIIELIRQGRSFGYIVILATQKPTEDTIPTQARDNASLRVAFRVKSSQAERAILGERSDEDTIFPTTIPSSKKLRGTAVIEDEETGKRKMVRFGYISEELIKEEVIKIEQMKKEKIEEEVRRVREKRRQSKVIDIKEA